MSTSDHEVARRRLETEIEAGVAAQVLTERYALVLRSRLGLGIEKYITLSQLAQNVGVSAHRARQIQMNAFLKLRNRAESVERLKQDIRLVAPHLIPGIFWLRDQHPATGVAPRE